jgi:hypothetical protein
MNILDWITVLKENFISDDIEDETLHALLNYLIDLGLLISTENDSFEWLGLSNNLDKVEKIRVMHTDFLRVSQSEMGFALPFFVRIDTELPTLESLIKTKEKNTKSKIIGQPERSSDLSNLQIVKKVGRQLEPFLKAESMIISRLIGVHTTKADAQQLFHYIFGKMGSKAQPRKWEQLSRKRHR